MKEIWVVKSDDEKFLSDNDMKNFVIDRLINDQDVDADETQDNDEKKNVNKKNDVNESEKDDEKIQKT